MYAASLTLAGGESGAPGVPPDTHHQRFPHQVVAFVALDLHSAPGVQAAFLSPAVQHVFGRVAASGRRHCGGGNGDSQTWQPHKSEVMEPNISLRSQVGAGALQVPLARQESVFGPTSCSPASHA